MSDIDNPGSEDGRRMAVAEYMIGVLEGPEREAVARMIETDPDMAAEAQFWESHLSTLNIAYKPVTPSPGILARVEARLFAPRAKPERAGWLQSLAFWRAATGLALAAAVVGIGLNVLAPQPLVESRTLVTALQPVEGELSVIALYDPATASLRLSATGEAAGAENDYELWLVPADGAPVSFGVFSPGAPVSVAVNTQLAAALGEGVTLAVSLEPAGGSPTGAPTGPILAAGVSAAI